MASPASIPACHHDKIPRCPDFADSPSSGDWQVFMVGKDTTELALEVLGRARRCEFPSRIRRGHPRLSICVALVESGHLDGQLIVQGTKVTALINPRITEQGENFLEQFEGISKHSFWCHFRPAWKL